MSGLSAYFDAVAFKTLTEVEVDPKVSNQHEFNGVAQLKPLLGVSERRREIYARHFDMERLDDSVGVIRLTWYDARFEHPTRSEWRLYYSPELVPSLEIGGKIVVARRDDDVFLFTARSDTLGAKALDRLFALDGLSTSFSRIDDDELSTTQVSVAEQLVLAELGIATNEETSLVDALFERFGEKFPAGEQLSEFVRTNTFGVDAVADPDDALLAWARVELELFNAMESKVETEKMDKAESLDAKLEVAMRIFQRRKSRAGKAFEYHLRAMFDQNGVSYSANPVTEAREEPDFIFPSIEKYRDESWPSSSLAMLAAKQTLRDRWRQVLNEASRIERKHLATLDLNISANQVREIDAAGVQLVLPKGLHASYGAESSGYFWTIAKFVAWLKEL